MCLSPGGLLLVCLLTLLLRSPESYALDIGLATSYRDHKYREEGQHGGTLVTEEGELWGARAFIARRFYGRIDIELGYSAYWGTIDYHGQTQAGASLETDTKEDYSSYDINVSYEFVRGDAYLAPIFTYSKLEWQRKIRATESTVALQGDYDWNEYGLGFKTGFRKGSGQLEFSLAALRTRGAVAKFDFSVLGVGNVKLKMDDDTGFRVKLGYSYQWKQWRLTPSLWHEEWHFGASDPKLVSAGSGSVFTIREPDSRTRQSGMEIALRRTL